MAVDGVRSAALVDIATGMAVRSAGAEGTDLAAADLAEGMLLFVDVDRARVNIALASLQVGQLVPAVLA
jgi:hypothetical protein